MALAPGTRLGPYEIVAAIGAGGMGEVYRARDTRLDRTVAIKILPESFANDRERLERLQQEARILSSLNYPNLMAVYDVGTQDGMHFLVSEFLEGETLRDRMNAGPLPQRRVIEYGLQIAKGLAAAHEKGIVHRDLKPENVFLLRDDRVKILDFGLAKQRVMPSTTDATMASPNQTSAGTVLGTAGYMSPEQVRGESVDYRSDIFSLGTILYEMISGQRAFRGDSSVEVMTSILKGEPPDLSESGMNVSLGLQRIVHRCLEKKPEARFQSASDLAFALDSLSSTGSTTSGGLRPLKEVEQKRSRILLPVLLLAMGLGSVSPDGKNFMTTDGERHYWVQPMDGSAPTEIKGLSPGDLPLEWHGGSENIFLRAPDRHRHQRDLRPEPRHRGRQTLVTPHSGRQDRDDFPAASDHHPGRRTCAVRGAAHLLDAIRRKRHSVEEVRSTACAVVR